MKSFLRTLFVLALSVLLLAACGGDKTTSDSQQKDQAAVPVATATESTPANTPAPAPTATKAPAVTEAPASKLEILEVTFAHGLDEDMTPIDESDRYTPEQPVYISVKLDGNPKEGIVSASFFYHEQGIAETDIDLAKSRKEQGVIFVVGGDTYVGFTLNHDDPFPISDDYRADLALDDTPAGSYAFQIIPPEDAIPSKMLSATLTDNIDPETYEPAAPPDTFSPDQEVFLAGRVALGKFSSISVRWVLAGREDPRGERVVTAKENIEDAPFYFSYLPAEGWPAGDHQAILYIDDEEVESYSFTIKPSN